MPCTARRRDLATAQHSPPHAGVTLPRTAAIVTAMDFRIARQARDRYAFDERLFSTDGEAIVLDTVAALGLAERFVEARDARARAASEIAALGLLHELAHRAVAVERRRDPGTGGPLARGLRALDRRLGGRAVDGSLASFEQAFPALPVYRDELTAAEWLARPRGEVPGREAALEELALAALGAGNPAAAAYRELIDDACLAEPAQRRVVDALAGADLPPDERDPDSVAPARALWARLREPILAAPQSLAAQLRWIRLHWVDWLDAADLLAIDREVGVLEELERASWLQARRTPGPAGGESFGGLRLLDEEHEAFSTDRDWMAELILVAKSTYVWLAQLSRAYGRDIQRLDQIPDEELDELRSRGFTGLWLIGLWERSPASRRIKQMRGNPDALASAYSVFEYRIADELGGDDAWRSLRDRAAARGVRLAADMVPNHMGIDSRWVVEHPERFISSPFAPFEAYAFTGEDLSSDGRVTIQIEDHYWDSSDAAVVFKRTDRGTGESSYIYHGNDGTSFPWNDTAQLDYLQAEVREAVIGQILEVARRFHVIRFDAAMVLARRHIQRLWYPLPGHEAGIPSRSAAALPAAELARRMPAEFWREVVDRVAAEVPDTLLLAEAFWLMEGYFVRTLGMHRVYNSAFMHMLRDEKNAAYQQVIRETLAFDARILGRYVNFMNNPDERSAIDQFGSHDKYFGVATMLATLPGLPMFGHGQVEGFSEQYGMEFRRPQRDESPDEGLVERHRREIFPLLRQRWRFADASGFRQLTAFEGGQEVADVFAYANRAERGPADARERRSLVVYLNRYARAHVRIPGVSEALDTGEAGAAFLILHDQRSGLDFLRDLGDLRANGLELELDGYACHVFLGFEAVSGPGWAELAMRVGTGGMPDASLAHRRLLEEPIRAAVSGVLATRLARDAFAPAAPGVPGHSSADGAPAEPADSAEFEAACRHLAQAAGAAAPTPALLEEAVGRLRTVRSLRPQLTAHVVAGWTLGDLVGRITAPADPRLRVLLFDEWDVASGVGDLARRAGVSDAHAWRASELARALLVLPPGALEAAVARPGLPMAWFDEPAVRAATGWNEWQGATYLSQEAWSELLDALAARDALPDAGDDGAAAAEPRPRAPTTAVTEPRPRAPTTAVTEPGRRAPITAAAELGRRAAAAGFCLQPAPPRPAGGSD
jgi:glycosidase